MIFLSHNSHNKNLVEPLYLELKSLYPNREIFYDSISIQPGDSIIGKMSDGLNQNNIFFLFWSLEASQSKMVEREWQSALSKSLNNQTKLVVVILDRTPLPEIMKDLKYLDLYSEGYNNVLNAIKNIIEGKTIFTPKHSKVNNIQTTLIESNEQLRKYKISTKFSVEYGIEYFISSNQLAGVQLKFDGISTHLFGDGYITINNINIPAKSISTMHKFVNPSESDIIIVTYNKEIKEKIYIGYKLNNSFHLIDIINN